MEKTAYDTPAADCVMTAMSDTLERVQMLNILKGTLLERQYEDHPFPLLSMEEYTDLVAESIRLLPEEMILHRMTGDGPGNLLVAPDWVRNKKKVLNTIHRKIAKG